MVTSGAVSVTSTEDLEPEQAWEWKLTYERRLNNDNGVLEGQVFYNQIEDHMDRVAATEIISAPGNIGDADLYGANLKGSWRLAPVGIQGAVIDAEGCAARPVR